MVSLGDYIIGFVKILNPLLFYLKTSNIGYLNIKDKEGKSQIINGVKESHIIATALDGYKQEQYQNPDVYYEYITSQIKDEDMYYILLDEVQLMDKFESVLNGLMRIKNLDIYVTGSNSKFLSSDVVTEFRGRGDEIKVYPLSILHLVVKIVA